MRNLDLNVVIDAQIYKDKLKLLLSGPSHSKSYIGITGSSSYTNLISNVILAKLSGTSLLLGILIGIIRIRMIILTHSAATLPRNIYTFSSQKGISAQSGILSSSFMVIINA